MWHNSIVPRRLGNSRTSKRTARRFIYRLREGHAPRKAVQQPVLFFQTTSPDNAWMIAKVEPVDRQDGYALNMALPTHVGAPVPLCHPCEMDWTPDGKSLVIRLGSPAAPDKTIIVTLESGTTFPPWPARGIRSPEDLSRLPRVREVPGWIYPSDSGFAYVYLRRTITRNIYRVPLP